VGPDRLRVSVVRMAGAHPVMAGAVGAQVDTPYAFLVTRRGAVVGQGYYPTVESLGEIMDLSELRPV
jgi:hypothetical protein